MNILEVGAQGTFFSSTIWFDIEFGQNGWHCKKLKYDDLKLTLFKVWEYNCKSDKRSKIISKVFSNSFQLYVN
jgi:hypothetical protein